MLARISSKLELFFLDVFIYVLSDSKWFRMLLRGFYAVKNDRAARQQFIYICAMFVFVGISLGWGLSMLLN